MRTYSDQYIEHYGDLFVKHDLFGKHLVRFETFLEAPDEILKACLSRNHEPLLPEQRRVQEQLVQEEELISVNGRPVELHGNQLIQPTHHREPSKGYKTNTRRAIA